MNLLVSAVIITHNRKELLMKAITSVMCQTYPNIELIVVDDASTDDISELMNNIEGVKYIYINKSESRGGNHARNVGINAAHGEYIAFLDDDDEWFPEKTAKQVTFLKNHTDFAFVHCGRVFEYDFSFLKETNIETLARGDYKRNVLYKIPFLTSCLMVRKAAIIKAGLFDENLRYWQEYELAIRLCQLSGVGLVEENLVLYRVLKKDKNRLTNQLAGWEKAVEYVNQKHAYLIKTLSSAENKKRLAMIAYDGINRSVAIGDSKSKHKYLKQLLEASPTIPNLVKYIFNYSGK